MGALEPGREHVVVGLSGGVDSAVAALRLLRGGARVTGLFMKNWEGDDTLARCGAEDDYAAARAVADHLGIPLHFINFAGRYRRDVFEPALEELAQGRTPNPDVRCNRFVKFDAFLHHALHELGAEAVATGHYARLAPSPEACHGPRLLRGRDPEKDQSYFLHAVSADALPRVRFPLGESTKEAVRREAREAGLPNAERPDSTGICFIGERDFASFVAQWIHAAPGPILDETGRRLGEHQGLPFYTLGQRRGLGLGGIAGDEGAPWYVADKDPGRNALIAVRGHDHPRLLSRTLEAGRPHWLGAAPAPGERLHAQVRYRQQPQGCVYHPCPRGGIRIGFDAPQRAVAPGQSVVLYRGEECLGGAVIERVPAPDHRSDDEPSAVHAETESGRE